MSKEREYYRKVINEYYQPVAIKSLAKAVLGVFAAIKIHEKVKSKIETVKKKEVESWNNRVKYMTDEEFYEKYGTEYKRVHPLKKEIEKIEKMKGFRDFETKKKK